MYSPQPDISQSCKTTDTGPVHREVCPLLALVLINRPRVGNTCGHVSIKLKLAYIPYYTILVY